MDNYKKIIRSKSGREITLRYPNIGDLDKVLEYINRISAEDTFITFSGEVITYNEEEKYLNGVLSNIAKGNSVVLYAFDGNKLIGIADVNRDLHGKKRTRHVGVFGITVAKEYRGDGIGEKLARSVIDEAHRKIEGLKMILLNVYGPNSKAQKLYVKLGFKEYGRLEKGLWYREEYYDSISMKLDL